MSGNVYLRNKETQQLLVFFINIQLNACLECPQGRMALYQERKMQVVRLNGVVSCIKLQQVKPIQRLRMPAGMHVNTHWQTPNSKLKTRSINVKFLSKLIC